MLALCLFLASCQLPQDSTLFREPDLNPATSPGTHDQGNWWSVYFTDPGSPEAASYNGGPGEELAEAISKARISVDIAAYSFNLWEIRDAILAANRRGVVVRLVTDSQNMDKPEIQELREAGIPVVDDRNNNLMHNKFFIIDQMEIWTGSMNPTLGGAYYDDNNLIRLRSSELAENYTVEFEEMFNDSSFSQGSPANTPHSITSIEGTAVETYFSPEDHAADRLIELIASTEENIHFLAYSFTSDDIASAMIERAQNNVFVHGVMERPQYRSNTGTEYERLISGGVDVRLDGNPDNMHHKVIILDESIVITGSYNFSKSAEERNDENMLIIHSPEIAAVYLEQFWSVYRESTRDINPR